MFRGTFNGAPVFPLWMLSKDNKLFSRCMAAFM